MHLRKGAFSAVEEPTDCLERSGQSRSRWHGDDVLTHGVVVVVLPVADAGPPWVEARRCLVASTPEAWGATRETRRTPAEAPAARGMSARRVRWPAAGGGRVRPRLAHPDTGFDLPGDAASNALVRTPDLAACVETSPRADRLDAAWCRSHSQTACGWSWTKAQVRRRIMKVVHNRVVFACWDGARGASARYVSWELVASHKITVPGLEEQAAPPIRENDPPLP